MYDILILVNFCLDLEQKPDQLLTDEDRELLQRWAKMQKANQPIAPKPETKPVVNQLQNMPGFTSLDSQQHGSTVEQKPFPSQQNFVHQSQQGLGNFQVQINQSDPKNLNSNSNQQGKSLIKVDTMHMLQQKLQARSGQSSQNIQQNNPMSNQGVVNIQHNVQTLSPAQQSFQAVSTNQVPQNVNDNISHNPCNLSTQPTGDLSTINMENLKMLGMSGNIDQRQSELEIQGGQTDLNQAYANENSIQEKQDFQVSGETYREFQSHGSPLSNLGSPQKDYSNHSSPESYQSAASPEYYGNQEAQHTPDTTPPRRSSQTDNSGSFLQQQQSYQPYNTTQNSNLNCANNVDYFQQHSPNASLANTIAMTANSNFHQQFQKEMHMPYVPVLPNSEQIYTPSMQEFQQNAEMPFSHTGQSSSTLPSRLSLPPRLTIDKTGNSPQPGPSNQGNPFTVNVDPDLISMLSKQFSKSQVEDTCPPALALTPRGTGAGYGLGMDLDTLMFDAQEVDRFVIDFSFTSP